MPGNSIAAIVLKAADYGESDKIITLFAPAEGKFTGILKGVKKEKAKLKFAAEPFCFGEFEFAKGGGGIRTVTGCCQKEAFFEITRDLTKFYCGYSVLELTSAAAQEDQENPGLFVAVLKTLRQLCSDEVSPAVVLVKFILDVFGSLGQRLTFNKCAGCGRESEKYFFDFESGGAVCGGCAGPSSFLPDPAVMSALKIISDSGPERLKTYKCGGGTVKDVLIFLNALIQNNVHKLKSLRELIEII